jgi:diacylglycerol kinase (ATP)
VGQLGRLGLLKTFPKIFDGSHLQHPAVRAKQVRSIEFRVEAPLDAMVDGEVITLWPERLDVLHHALEVCV